MILLLASASAWAWSTLDARWPDDQMPIPWSIAEPIGVDVDLEAAVAAIQAGVSVWEDAGCGVSFRYEGLVSDAEFSPAPDGRNTVFVLGEGWPEEAALLSTQQVRIEGRSIVEADVAINAQDFVIVLEGSDGASRFDLQGAIAHEFAHVVGLWHATDPTATAHLDTNGTEAARDLAQDDLDGLCWLYGTGDATIGEACTDNLDCVEPFFCLDDAGSLYCSDLCDPSDAEPCPGDLVCTESASASVCALPTRFGNAEGCGCATGGAAGGHDAGAVGPYLAWVAAAWLARRRSAVRALRRLPR